MQSNSTDWFENEGGVRSPAISFINSKMAFHIFFPGSSIDLELMQVLFFHGVTLKQGGARSPAVFFIVAAAL